MKPDLEAIRERAHFAKGQDYLGIDSYRVARDFAECMDDRDALLAYITNLERKVTLARDALEMVLTHQIYPLPQEPSKAYGRAQAALKELGE